MTSWETHPQTRERLRWLIKRDAVPWGCLVHSRSVDELVVQLQQDRPVRIPDLDTLNYHVYHTRALGVACVSRISTALLHNAVTTQQLSDQTLIYLQYRYGNLRALIRGQELPPTLAMSADIYLLVSVDRPALISTHVGAFHPHQTLYDYRHLDGRVTTLQKLLTSKHFTTVWVTTPDPTVEIEDIPY